MDASNLNIDKIIDTMRKVFSENQNAKVDDQVDDGLDIYIKGLIGA